MFDIQSQLFGSKISLIFPKMIFCMNLKIGDQLVLTTYFIFEIIFEKCTPFFSMFHSSVLPKFILLHLTANLKANFYEESFRKLHNRYSSIQNQIQDKTLQVHIAELHFFPRCIQFSRYVFGNLLKIYLTNHIYLISFSFFGERGGRWKCFLASNFKLLKDQFGLNG